MEFKIRCQGEGCKKSTVPVETVDEAIQMAERWDWKKLNDRWHCPRCAQKKLVTAS